MVFWKILFTLHFFLSKYGFPDSISIFINAFMLDKIHVNTFFFTYTWNSAQKWGKIIEINHSLSDKVNEVGLTRYHPRFLIGFNEKRKQYRYKTKMKDIKNWRTEFFAVIIIHHPIFLPFRLKFKLFSFNMLLMNQKHQ